MGFTDDADDWQVLCIDSVGAGFGLAVMAFIFDFFSEKADITARFRLVAFGSGIGGGSAGWAVPGLSDWSEIDCKRPFSAQKLHQCAATVATATVGVGANIGPCLISAIMPTGVSLFEDQDAGGLSGGLSAGAYALAGTWKFLRVVSNRPAIPIVA
ncbi:MAG TPA: hypothetical protein VKF84_17585 [Candidatus Sulfotelmatobacter sp.]|nr:hypothetical protein [Candidatus Sulfotelmatobacter sp.]